MNINLTYLILIQSDEGYVNELIDFGNKYSKLSMVYIDDNLKDNEAKNIIDNQVIDVLIISNKKYEKLKDKVKDNFNSNMLMVNYYNKLEGMI